MKYISSLGEICEAQLHFEQSIKFNNSRRAVMSSLIDIIKIKIEQRDLYAAYHTLCRAESLEISKSQPIDRLGQFLEGVSILLKK